MLPPSALPPSQTSRDLAQSRQLVQSGKPHPAGGGGTRTLRMRSKVSHDMPCQWIGFIGFRRRGLHRTAALAAWSTTVACPRFPVRELRVRSHSKGTPDPACTTERPGTGVRGMVNGEAAPAQYPSSLGGGRRGIRGRTGCAVWAVAREGEGPGGTPHLCAGHLPGDCRSTQHRSRRRCRVERASHEDDV
jgi:hypothetical protein